MTKKDENKGWTKIWKWLKQNWLPYTLLLVVVAVGWLIGYYCARCLPLLKDSDIRATDTVYVEHVVYVDTIKVSPITVPQKE